MSFKVRIVNPGRSNMRNKRGQFTKKSKTTRRRRRRRRNPEIVTNPRRRRRRRGHSSGGRRRRRRNPSGGGWGGYSPIKSFNLRDLLPYGLAQLAQAAAVRRWGDTWGTSLLSGGMLETSGYRGQAWTLKNYLICAAVGWVGAKVIAKTGALGGQHAANIWWRSTVEQMFTRLAWTEVFGRWNWGRTHFGQLPTNCKPGDVHDDGAGNRWVCAQNGQWVSMQGPLNGYYGELVQAGPLGYGELVQAGPLGYGELVQAGPLGDSGFTPMGHLMDPSTSNERSYHAQQLGLGAKDPYAAIMSG